MEQASTKTLCSTEGTTAKRDDNNPSDSNESVELARPRKGSHMETVTNPQRKWTMPAGLIPKKTGFGIFKSAKNQTLSTWHWKTHKSLVYGISSTSIKFSTKIALFDMDGTLIVNKLGRRNTDWEFFDVKVPEKLRELSSKGYRIVIASNQLGISLNLVSEKDIQKKVESFISTIGVEATVMLSTKNDSFRKPEPGMWNFLCNVLNPCQVNLADCVDISNLVLRRRLCRPSCFWFKT